ncbi:MAG: hypothetical protein V1729_03545 [Candidatus Woesearchaeota archaeon]
MVDLNATIFPILGPVGTFINTVKVFVGGVFGIYLILLYLRWKEYLYVRSTLSSMRKEIRAIAEHEGVKLDPIKRHSVIRLGGAIKKLLTCDRKKEKASKSGKNKK